MRLSGTANTAFTSVTTVRAAPVIVRSKAIRAGNALLGVRTGARPAAQQLCEDYRGDPADVDSEILTGFLAALHAADPAEPRLAAKLVWAGKRAGVKLVWADCRHEQAKANGSQSRTPPPLYGHPYLLLGRAVALGIISAEHAALIGYTRLEKQSVEKVAQRFGQPAQALRMQRRRAELKIVQAMNEGLLGTVVADATSADLGDAYRVRNGLHRLSPRRTATTA